MKSKYFTKRLLACMSVISIIVFATTIEARPSNKWRLHFDGQAKNTGIIVIEVTPESGQPIRIQSEIEDNTKENKAAKKVAMDLEATLGNGYKVKEQDGEEVKIKAKRGTQDFELEIISNTIDGLKVKTDRE